MTLGAPRAFALLNGRDLGYDVDDAESFVMAVAAGELDVHAMSAWLAAHVVDG